MSRRLVIASNNQHKVSELARMVAEAAMPEIRELEVVSIGSLPEYGIPPEVGETADSFSGNAMLKADGFAAWLRTAGAPRDELILADDSGLCVDAFGGEPGVYSARWAGKDASDEDNNAKLVAELEARGMESSPAEYVCVLAIRRVGARPFDFTLPDAGSIYLRENCLCIEGRCTGNIRVARRGQGGFGYDPHFWIDDDTRTFAELSQREKSERSHRGAAMRRLMLELPLILRG
jgi:XTP/dITP diphosphohydrolase